MKRVAAFALAFLSTLAAQPPTAGQLVTVKGTVSIVGPELPPGFARVVLQPLGYGNVSSAEVRTDGTFTIDSVRPGHWRLSVEGTYIKSVTRGGREVSAADIEIGAQAGPPLKIVGGTNFPSLRVTAPAQPPSPAGIFLFLWINGGPDGPVFPVTRDQTDMFQPGGLMSVPPGRHLVCAFVGSQPWMTFRGSLYFRALRPALESHCQAVEALEGGQVTIQAVPAPFISAADVKRLTEN